MVANAKIRSHVENKFVKCRPIAFVLLVFGSIICLWVIKSLLTSHLAERLMLRLLTGAHEVEITKFVIDGQQRRVECHNREVCEYLAAVIRRPHAWKDRAHFCYDVMLSFSDGLDYHVPADIAPNQISFSISAHGPVEPGIPTRTVFLDSDAPASVRQIWAFLLAPHKDISGYVLVVPTKGDIFTRFDDDMYDASNF